MLRDINNFSRSLIQTDIARIVSSIQPVDVVEEEHKLDTLMWLNSGLPIFRIEKPATPPKHLVTYFVLIDTLKQEILLCDHKKAGLWLPPGGHVEFNEHPKAAAERECLEELGVKANFLFGNPLFLSVTPTVGAVGMHIDVSLWYTMIGDNTFNFKLDCGEFNRVSWFEFDKIPFEKSQTDLPRFIAKLKMTLETKRIKA